MSTVEDQMPEGIEGIPPSPVPTAYRILTTPPEADPNGQAMVVLEQQTPNGITFTFWGPEAARAMAHDLTVAATEAERSMRPGAKGKLLLPPEKNLITPP